MLAIPEFARTWMCVRGPSPPGRPEEESVRWALVDFLIWGGGLARVVCFSSG